MLPLLFSVAVNLYSPPSLTELPLDQQIHSLRLNQGLETPLVLPLLNLQGTADALQLHLHLSRRAYGNESPEAIESLMALTGYVTNNYTDIGTLENISILYSLPIQDSRYLFSKTTLALALFEYYITLPLHEYRLGITGTAMDARNSQVSRSYLSLRSCLKDYQAYIEDNVDNVQYNQIVKKMNQLITDHG